MEIKELKTKLRDLGFAEYESNILLFLSKTKKYLDAKEIERGAGVPIARIYSILLNLEEDGLIKKIPGRVSRYGIVELNKFIDLVLTKNKKELVKKEKKIVSSADSLKEGLSVITSEIKDDVEINYFGSSEGYWKIYNDVAARLKKGDTYRILNSKRLCEAFLDEELDDPMFQKVATTDNDLIRRGILIHIITTPESIVRNTFNDLGNKVLVKKALSNMLKTLGNKRYLRGRYITLAPEFKSMIFIIFKEDAFMEFYSGKSNDLSSAIHIKSRSAVRDLAIWFDKFDNNAKHDGIKDFEEFEKEIRKWAMKICQIKL